MKSEYPVCAFCGSQSADRYLQGRAAMICGDCATRRDLVQSSSVVGTCALCGRVIGTTRGILRRRPVVAGLSLGGDVACTECISHCRTILADDYVRAEKA